MERLRAAYMPAGAIINAYVAEIFTHKAGHGRARNCHCRKSKRPKPLVLRKGAGSHLSLSTALATPTLSASKAGSHSSLSLHYRTVNYSNRVTLLNECCSPSPAAALCPSTPLCAHGLIQKRIGAIVMNHASYSFFHGGGMTASSAS